MSRKSAKSICIENFRSFISRSYRYDDQVVVVLVEHYKSNVVLVAKNGATRRMELSPEMEMAYKKRDWPFFDDKWPVANIYNI